jgi:hypothetical protein
VRRSAGGDGTGGRSVAPVTKPADMPPAGESESQRRARWPAGRPATAGPDLAGDACVGAALAVESLGGLAVGVDELDLLLARGLGHVPLVDLDVLV